MGIQINNHLSNIVETNDLDSLSYFGMEENEECKEIETYLLDTFKNALELGSLIKVETRDFDKYQSYIDEIHDNAEISADFYFWKTDIYSKIVKLIIQAEILSKKYCVTTTNPPYLNKMAGELKKYVVKNYKPYSSDLFAVFIRRNFDFTVDDGYLGFMTPFVWMFIKSYESLRKYIIENKSITTLVQMEYSAYEEATVPICCYVLKNGSTDDVGYYFRLSDFKGGMEVQNQKVLEAINNKNCGYFYETSLQNFNKIPGSPIAYWCINFDIFKFNSIGYYYESGGRNKTHNNDLYVRKWWEINNLIKWQPYDNGGEFRHWYGNNLDLVDWSDKSKNDYASHGGLYNPKFLGKSGICWNLITSYKNGFRIKESQHHYSSAAPTIISMREEYDRYVLAFLNSVVSTYLLGMLNPTLNTTVGDVLRLPLIIEDENKVNIEATKSLLVSKEDWDSFEISWDFKIHPLVKNHVSTISEAYSLWEKECNDRFNQLKSIEEELNRTFINIYDLQDELDSYEEDKDVTVRKADLVRDIKSFISYAVGCMFGRYSLDTEGLAYVAGKWDSSKYNTFIPDADDIIPICDEEYFEDDIVSRLVEFVRCVYGNDTLEENLQFISVTLGGNGNPRDVLRKYFLKDFFIDHYKMYQKRPIYWLFDSGKKNGFKALIYIHRYTPDLIARMRTGYIHPLQSQYRTQIKILNNQIDETLSTSGKFKLQKQLKKVTEQSQELGKYEEKIHHWADKMEPMNLDDGVKVNYSKFQELLAKIK